MALKEVLSNPVFGITITLAAYMIGIKVHRRLKTNIANPLLIACVLIIGLLVLGDIPFDTYNQGGRYITFLLGPATVALAVPLYKNIKLVKKNISAIISAISCGCVVGVLSASLIALVLGGDEVIAYSMAPKSVTSPIAMEISRILGGIPSITGAVVAVTGIIGAMVGPETLKLFGIKDPIAVGTAMGTASHGMGTSRAVTEGSVQGAMSGLAIGIAGVITSIIAPLLLKLIT
ncbi:MAG: LrgB family protein [Mahellales bacterium]